MFVCLLACFCLKEVYHNVRRGLGSYSDYGSESRLAREWRAERKFYDNMSPEIAIRRLSETPLCIWEQQSIAMGVSMLS